MTRPDKSSHAEERFAPSALRTWLLGARLPTLPASIVPVAVGTAVVPAVGGSIVAWRLVAAVVVAVALQVATNFANDYSDGVRGTDSTDRVGPPRLVGSGLVPASLVRRAAFIGFGVAMLAGAGLALAAGPELFVVGAAAVAAGWFYTGGSRPYGYAGLGELFVFVFFGLVATIGSAYVHLERVEALAVVVAVPLGFLATALLVVNNLHDIPGDETAGKRTLAVRLGAPRTRLLFLGLIIAAFLVVAGVGVGRPPVLLVALAVPAALGPSRLVKSGAEKGDLIPALVATGRTQLVFGLLLTGGLIAS